MQNEAELVEHLIHTGILRSPQLVEAFKTVDRIDFVRPEYRDEAYGDYPLPIGYGQTISQPFTVAFMLEALQVGPDDTVLDIGSGSGWTTALLACCAKEVTGVERINELVAFATNNLHPYHFENATVRPAGHELGIPGRTFDRILVSAAADTMPQTLLAQLNPNGILVIPVRHSIIVLKKDPNGQISQRVFEGFSFVPLI